ncbi:MAG: hypothetical protein WBG42_04895 [Cryomorphaceae bacterium]
MKKLMTILSVVFFIPLFSQNVGINNTGAPADNSAMLDVSANDKGVLIPRLTSAQRTGISAPAEGLLVYQSDGESGFYYWDGLAWVTFLDDKKGWSLDGNAGTDPLTDYVGTSDATDFNISTNGAARISLLEDGRVGLTGNQFFDPIAGINVAAFSSGVNTAFGASTSGTGDAIYGGTFSTGVGLRGLSSGSGDAIYGGTFSTGAGVRGISSGAGVGVVGNSLATSRAGEFSNLAENTTQTIFALQTAANTANTTAAIWGESSSTAGGVFLADLQDNITVGATGQYIGGGNFDAAGLFGFANSNTNWGYGVIGQGNWYGVYAVGDLGTTGIKTFCIDHPSEPDKKMLKHFSIESDEVLNVYRGNAQLNEDGSVEIVLPEYFKAINRNFSYHLTPVGASMPNLFVSDEINENTFTISGGVPNAKVSWMVQAERNDKYLQENPKKREPEVQKKPEMQGKYLDPDSWNQPERNGYFYKMRKQPLGKSDRQTPEVVRLNEHVKDTGNEKSRP